MSRIVIQGFRSRATHRALIGTLIACLQLLGGCMNSADPGSDSSTHFLHNCAFDGECSAEYQCICGYCTKECASGEDCRAAGAICESAAEVLSCSREVSVCGLRLSDRTGSDIPDSSAIPQLTADARMLAPEPADAAVIAETDAAIAIPFSSALATVPSVAKAPLAVPTASEGNPAASTSSAPLAVPSAKAPASDPSQAPSEPLPSEDPTIAYADQLSASWNGFEPAKATDCELASASSDVASCDQRWQCDGASYTAGCYSTDQGWYCECAKTTTTSEESSVAYFVETATTDDACTATLDACTTPASGEVCTVTFRKPEVLEYDYSCQWEEACLIPVSTPATTVRMANPRHGFCSPENGYQFCSCAGESMHRTYSVTDLSGDTACAAVQESCASSSQPAEWKPLACWDYEQTAGNSACSVVRHCPTTASVSPQLTALLTSRNAVYCSDSGSQSDCTLSADDAVYAQWNEMKLFEPTVCHTGLDLTDDRQNILWQGTKAHEHTDLNYVDDECLLEQRYTQVGTWQALSRTFIGSVRAECSQPTVGDLWHCTCSSNDYFEDLMLEDSESLVGLAACEQLMDSSCLSHLRFVPGFSAP